MVKFEIINLKFVIILLLCGMGHTAAVAYGYDRNAQSGSWGYQPVYNATTEAPTYEFRTTSSYINTGGYTDAESLLSGSKGPRRVSPFDFSLDDNPIGEVDDPMPIGDLPWLFMLLLAAGCAAFRPLRQRNA